MLIKALAASALMLGIATSAMAQSDMYRRHTRHHHVSNAQVMPVDPYATGSIYSGSPVNPSPLGPCASNTPGPDANSGLNVNDHYCGK